MLDFEKVCDRMGLSLEPINLDREINKAERDLMLDEFNLHSIRHSNLRTMKFYDIALIVVLGLATVATIVITTYEGTGFQLNIPANAVALIVMLIMLLTSLFYSCYHLVKLKRIYAKIQPVPCKAFKTACNPSALEDIANGVLPFRVLEDCRDVFKRTDEWLILVRDGSIPYLISYTSKSSWGTLDFSRVKLLTEVLEDAE